MVQLVVLLTLVVSAPNRDYTLVPVSAALPAQAAGSALVMREAGTNKTVPCQVVKGADGARIWWIVRDLKKGQSKTFQVMKAPGPVPAGANDVKVVKGDKAVDVTLGSSLFTRYVFTDGPKPYCYPIIGPTGGAMTRSFPMEKVEGEPADHPHHRSMWFTHGGVNGVDFWAEGAKMGKTVHRAFDALEGGPVMGRIRATDDWMTVEGKKVCEETREIRFYQMGPDMRMLDFEITFRATEGEVVFTDTKEGSFGFRLAKSLQLKGGEGHIENARGDKDGTTWGKQAEWCDYYGPVDGKTTGIAIFDTPGNLRYPTYWHVRDYGLFAANPWGLHDFLREKGEPGRYAIPKGGSLTMRYRVLFHKGSTAEAHVADLFGEYSEPPKVEAK